MSPIGVVVKSPSIYYYIFKPFRRVDVGTFVSTDVDGTKVLSRVVAVRYKNAAADPRLLAQFDESNIEEIKAVLGIEESLYYTEAKALVLGARRGRKIYRPQKPVKPLTYVYMATEVELEEFFAPPEEGIAIGKIRGTEIPAKIDAERLVTHHCLILASTGAGKSWLAGVLVERLSLLEIPIIVLDPHGEYSAMSIPTAGEGERVAEKVRIYVVGKVDTEPIDQAFRQRYGKSRSYVRVGINPRSLPLRTLEKILDATYGLTDAQRRVLEEGWQHATGYGERQPLTSIEELVREVVEGGRHAAPPGFAGEMTVRGLEGRLKALFYGSRVFITKYGETYLGEPLRLIDPPTCLSPSIHIFDVSGLEDLDQQIFVAVLLDQLYRAATRRRDTAAFIVIEEAHNFAPASPHSVSRPYVAKIAREGRKFGLGLCLITQRPTKLDQDVASQAMTQIFKRMINPTDLRYVSAVAEHLEDVRILKTLDETEAVVTGLAAPLPLFITVESRWTNHGGVTPRLRKEAI
ncbi:MAG: helicase HerA domain-containing protein [Pyrobaculum sp.]